MGGQACVLYGAAEFSKDFDFILLLEESNLTILRQLVTELQGEVIAVPDFEYQHLEKGHAVHFRALAPGWENLRIDVMCKLRGVDDFATLWNRRTSAEILPGLSVDILSLPDLVQAKKTQRDKDWPMVRRLVDVDYIRGRNQSQKKQASFWIRELRTPEFLIECVADWQDLATEIAKQRGDVIYGAMHASRSMTQKALDDEEKLIREADFQYWLPLKQELEIMRRMKKKN